jgi:hypothetical protein
MGVEARNDTALLDAVSLKTRFKKRCTDTNDVYQNWQIRVHRSLSWLKRASELPDDQPDLKFMLLWVSLNSLYSTWDNERNAPAHERVSRGRFVRRRCGWDGSLVGETLQKNRSLVKKVLENFYLSNTFWRDPDNPKSKGWAAEDANYLDRNLKQQNFLRVLEQVLERLFVMRGQLVHGAATGGGRLNRQTLGSCVRLLGILAPLIVHLTIEHGCNDDWPDMCYPPLGN